MASGVEGAALTWIEHMLPRSIAPERTDDYANCLYACRWCNLARGDAPNVDGTTRAQLLDPCLEVWSTRFELVADVLRARAGDRDAEHTADTYDLADARKTTLRARRRLRLARARSDHEHAGTLIPEVQARDASRERDELLAALRRLQDTTRATLEDLGARPDDADAACSCDAVCALPTWLAEQCWSVLP